MAIIRDYDVVIIGAGPAGMTAALYAGRAMLRTVVLEAGLSGGELLRTEYLDDVIGFPMIKGDELAQKFEEHAKKFGANFVNFTNVTSVQKIDAEMFATEADNGDVYMSPVVIVTSGGTPVKLGIPGELEFAGRGVSYCAICDANFFRKQVIAVVGGGDAACEEADYLTRFADKVYLIHRRDEFRASKVIQKHVFSNPKIEVVFNTVAEEVVGTKGGLMTGLRTHNLVTGDRHVLDVTGLFVFIGFKPNTDIIKGHYKHDALGYVVTDAAMMSSIPGLFVAGDLRSQLTRQVTTAAGDATTAAIASDKYLKDLREARAGVEKAVEEAVQTSHLNLGGWT
ncbi:MAG TPA: FAD-dependent oxidoreductase [Gemmatimonadaceae bacterium]|nr:FAD-dependent oxidoreductase [Gemmatimonadaceae bacterium]